MLGISIYIYNLLDLYISTTLSDQLDACSLARSQHGKRIGRCLRACNSAVRTLAQEPQDDSLCFWPLLEFDMLFGILCLKLHLKLYQRPVC